MKRKIGLILIMILLLIGCTKEETKETTKTTNSKPARIKEANGPVVMAELNKDGNIVIKKESISETATYITYEYDGVKIGLLAVKDSNGEIKVVVNTCQSCGGSPYAFFIQVGNSIQCQNCGNLFLIDNLDNLNPDGCNPIKIEDRKDSKDEIIIGVKQLQDLKDKFVKWEGPKA